MLKIGGINYHVKEQGQGIAFVWAHGLLSSLDDEDYLDWFRHGEIAKSVRLIRYDALGHGNSGGTQNPDDYTWQKLSATMNSIASQLTSEQCIVGGVSMGCATAIYAALQFPDKIKGLVLVNPPTAWHLRPKQATNYKRMAKLAGINGGLFIMRLITLISILRPGTILFKLLINTLLSKSVKNKKIQWKQNRKIISAILKGAAMSDFPDKESITSIKQPTLILAWIKDKSHPVETAIELNKLLPNSELHIAKTYADFLKRTHLLKDFLKKHQELNQKEI